MITVIVFLDQMKGVIAKINYIVTYNFIEIFLQAIKFGVKAFIVSKLSSAKAFEPFFYHLRFSVKRLKTFCKVCPHIIENYNWHPRE